MTRNWTPEEAAEVQERLRRNRRTTPAKQELAKALDEAAPTGTAQAPKPNKYGAVRTVAPASWGGTRIADSKAGADLSRTLETRKQVGSIIDWFEEVSLPVGVNERGRVIRYRADAMILLGYVDAPDGEPALVVRFVDRKRAGMDTRTSATKRAALRNRGLNVEVVT